MYRHSLAVFLLVLCCVGGCASHPSHVPLVPHIAYKAPPAPSPGAPRVQLVTVTDERPLNASAEKAKTIAASYCLGGEMTVPSLVRRLLEDAFAENGYAVVQEPQGALRVSAAVTKFWLAFEPKQGKGELVQEIAVTVRPEGKSAFSVEVRSQKTHPKLTDTLARTALRRGIVRFHNAACARIDEELPVGP